MMAGGKIHQLTCRVRLCGVVTASGSLSVLYLNQQSYFSPILLIFYKADEKYIEMKQPQ